MSVGGRLSMSGPLDAYRDRVYDRAPGQGMVRDEADYVIVGTGPSGAAVAQALTLAGADVIMIEEGRRVDAEEFVNHAFTTQKSCYRELGTIAAMGKNVIPIIQGRGVGGGSLINAAIIWRMPEDVYDRWDREHQVSRAVSWAELESAFDTLEHDLHVQETRPEVLGRNSELLKAGADALGISSRIIPRNERGCQGKAQCVVGCPVRAKQSMDLNYVPWSLGRGARLYTACRADHIDVTRGRARIVQARFEDPLTREPRGRLAAHARKGVIVCASPIQTPLLLARSGIGLTSGRLGRHFMGHPGSGLICVYPDEVRMWEGATQGWDSEHFRQSDRVKFESLSIPPDLMTVRLPGLGAEFKRSMLDYDRLGNVGCAIVAEAEGRVIPLGNGGLVSYSITPSDVVHLRKGLKILAEVMFAAGATEVWPGVYGMPPRIKPDELKLFDSASLKAQSYTLVVTHLFGTARIGPDPRTSVVNHGFEVHDTRGVYVLDSSFFPTNLGVNPQHTIMAFATAAARKISAN
jgi:choline dehydrogenase-like flavoprotein